MAERGGESYYQPIRPYAESTRGRNIESPRLSERQERSLIDMVRQNPAIARYLPPNGPSGAKGAINDIDRFLTTNPYIVTDVEATHDYDNPDQITMAIILNGPNDRPLVVSESQVGLTAFAPVLGCTLNAIRDIREREGLSREEYEVFASDNRLIEVVWQMINSNPNGILSYDDKTMRPEDYVALGAQGALYDEVFRANLRRYSSKHK